jgi:hypothetical protein
VNSVNHVNSVKVVDSGVETDLVENSDTGLNSFLLKGLHGVRNIGSSDDVLLELDSGLDDVGVLSVGDERDDEVVFLDGSVERSFIRGVDGESGGGTGKGRSERLSGGESSATCNVQSGELQPTQKD